MCNKKITNKIKNISQEWKILNPEYELKIYDDQMCEQFLLEEMSELHCNIFKYIPFGPIKSHFWRCCILYKYGGVYADTNIKPLLPLSEVIEDDCQFVTCLSYYSGYNLNFIISEPEDPLLKYLIDTYVEYYNTKKENNGYWDWNITRLLDIYTYSDESTTLKYQQHNKEGIYIINNKKYQLLKSVSRDHQNENHVKYNNKLLFNIILDRKFDSLEPEYTSIMDISNNFHDISNNIINI